MISLNVVETPLDVASLCRNGHAPSPYSRELMDDPATDGTECRLTLP